MKIKRRKTRAGHIMSRNDSRGKEMQIKNCGSQGKESKERR